MKQVFFLFFYFYLLPQHGSFGGRGGFGRGGGGGGSGGGRGGSRGVSHGFSGPRSMGRGSISSHSVKTVATGLAGGFVGYQGAKTARKISSGSSKMYYPSIGITYYFGDRYYSFYATPSKDAQACRYIIEPGDEYFNLTYEDDGMKVSEIVYNCKSSEKCCDGLDCCISNDDITLMWIIVGCILSVLAVIFFVLMSRYIYIEITDRKSRKSMRNVTYTINTPSHETTNMHDGLQHPVSQYISDYNINTNSCVPKHYAPVQQQPNYVPTYS